MPVRFKTSTLLVVTTLASFGLMAAGLVYRAAPDGSKSAFLFLSLSLMNALAPLLAIGLRILISKLLNRHRTDSKYSIDG
jgi:hypothetical protein